ncbi:uncharacterized protein TrAtP1_001190 [Trichoderma atroviride]|uniref:uncharacterized protein n=1 Tax=Hypocrea atroviridis TaxID=63577 RepID=UPI0033218827|nr:hypothetical protein TrAtP1_001190 [Trichoderma atroviride]
MVRRHECLRDWLAVRPSQGGGVPQNSQEPRRQQQLRGFKLRERAGSKQLARVGSSRRGRPRRGSGSGSGSGEDSEAALLAPCTGFEWHRAGKGPTKGENALKP